MNQFVSGESDAKGLSVILPYIAFDRADVAIRRPGILGTLGIRQCMARRGAARFGRAWRGNEYGKAALGTAGLCTARLGWARQGIWLGPAWRGGAWNLARHG